MARRIMLSYSSSLMRPMPSSAKYRSAVNWASNRPHHELFAV